MSTLAEINKTLQTQTETLKSVNEVWMAMLKEERDAREAAERDRVRQLEETREAKKRAAGQRQEPRGFVGGLRAGFVEASGLGFLGGIGGWAERLMGSLFGGASFAVVAGALGRMIARGAIFGGLALLVANYGRDLIDYLFENVLPDSLPDIFPDDWTPDLSPDARNRIADSVTTGMQHGLLAAMIPGVGMRGGVGVMLGSVVGAGINAYLGEEENQRVIANVLGREITSADAVSATMQAAGLAAMLAGPMAGIVVALGGLGVVAGTRLQEWIENRRVEMVDNMIDELDRRHEEGRLGDTLGRVGLLGTIATALGLNIQSEEMQSADALIVGINQELQQIRRNQQAAQGFDMEFGPAPGEPEFGRGAINLQALSDAEQASLTEAGLFLEQLYQDQRVAMRDYSAQSLQNLSLMAESLGRQDIVDYIGQILAGDFRDNERAANQYLQFLNERAWNAHLQSLPGVGEAEMPDVYDPPRPNPHPADVYPQLFSMQQIQGQALPESRSDAETLQELVAFLSTQPSAGASAPVIINNDNSSPSYNSSHIRYDQSISPYDMQDYMRRGLIPPAIGAHY